MSKQPTTSIAAEIETRQLGLLYGQNHLAAISTLIAGIFLSWILWDVIDHIRILSWLAVLVVATLGRILLVARYNKLQPPPGQSEIWRKRILVVATLFGVIWGSASVFLFAEESIPHIAFTGFVLVGIAGGAVPYLAAVWPVYLLTALPATLLFAFRLFLLGGEIATFMGLLILFFSAMMIFTSWRMKEMVVESIKLRFDKETLAKDLKHAKTVKEQATIVAKESDERAHVLAEAPFEGIFIHEQGQILDANQTLLDLLGLRMEDALGRQVLDFVEVESHDRIAKELQNPKGKEFKTSIVRPDGKRLFVEVRGRHFPRKGRTIRVVSLRLVD
ncbi:MAG: PAS domain-containing protein [Acidiferrobacterales bacterium]